MILRFNSCFTNSLQLYGLSEHLWYSYKLKVQSPSFKNSTIFDSMMLFQSNPKLDLYKIYLTKEELLDELRQTN